MEDEYGISITEELAILDAMQKKQPTTLKNSVDTRWNTLLNMFRSFSQNFETLNIALIKANKEAFVFMHMEKNIIHKLAEFLAIFEKATIYFQGRNYSTICSVICFFEHITKNLRTNEIEAEFGIIINLYEFAKFGCSTNGFMSKKLANVKKMGKKDTKKHLFFL